MDFETGALLIKPGDTLLLPVPETWNPDQIEAYRVHITPLFDTLHPGVRILPVPAPIEPKVLRFVK